MITHASHKIFLDRQLRCFPPIDCKLVFFLPGGLAAQLFALFRLSPTYPGLVVRGRGAHIMLLLFSGHQLRIARLIDILGGVYFSPEVVALQLEPGTVGGEGSPFLLFLFLIFAESLLGLEDVLQLARPAVHGVTDTRPDRLDAMFIVLIQVAQGYFLAVVGFETDPHRVIALQQVDDVEFLAVVDLEDLLIAESAG